MEARKMVLMNSFAGQEQRCRHREQTSGQSRGKGGWEESSIETYMLTYVKQLVGSFCITQGAQPDAL